jgi:hypothetical protein
MKNNFGHNATTSFTLWFEHHMLKYGEAYNNFETDLYYIEDERLPNGFYRYSSPYKQWVHESVSGANVPEYISNASGPVDKTDSNNGYFIDFFNGGVVFTGNASNENMQISGSFATKDFNIYNTNQSEESLIIESKFDTNSRFYIPQSGISPYDFVVPAVFINNEYVENEPFALGGENKTTLNFKAVVFAENLYQLDGMISLFADTRDCCFAELTFADHPINEYGDLKSRPYKYEDLSEQRKDSLFFIERVTTSKISENVSQAISPTLYIGFLDFEVSKLRFPRKY